ncbi:macrophage colony-stimulating factor 1 receptor 2 [Polymixia lowei]
MSLNFDLVSNGSEVVLTAGSAFSLRCHGNGSVLPVRWSTTAFLLRHRVGQNDTLSVSLSDPRHTGTYRCGSQNHSLSHLDSWLHIYITDSTHPSHLFVTPRTRPNMVEGQDFLFECLLTNPYVTDLAFRLKDDVGGGRGLPRGMNVTLDPRQGALIRELSLAHKGQYVCSARKDGKEYTSPSLHLLVVSKRRSPPQVSVSQKEFIRLEGEGLDVTCLTSNPSHFYTVTWTHPHIQKLNVTLRQQYRDKQLFINSSLTVAAVKQRHTGDYTCTAVNQAGIATATTRLTVLDAPYLRIYLQTVQHANVSTKTMEVSGELLANVSTKTMEVSGELLANVSTKTMEVSGELLANVSTKTMEVSGELLANVSTNRTELNGAGHANVSGSIMESIMEVYGGVASRVEVDEGRDVELRFVTEAYPPLLHQAWTTPSQNTILQERYSTTNNRYEASLLVRRVRAEDRGRYSFHYSSRFFKGSLNVHLRVHRSPSVEIKLTENRTLTCSSSGYPLPTILWYICPGTTQTCGDNSTYQVAGTTSCSEEEETQRQLFLPWTSDDVTVECVAFNHMGTSRNIFISYALAASRGTPTFFTLNLIGASIAATALFLLLLVVLYKYKQKPRYEIRWKIIESNHGNNYSFVDPTQLPYNQKWEFPRERLRLGGVLGAGAFGKVVEATAYDLGAQGSITRVAVKMLKPRAHWEERNALMSELKILSHLGYHDNIVNLLGACTHGGPMLMITEYCSHGDLLNFLRGQTQGGEGEESELYKNMAAQQARIRSDSGISCCSEMSPVHPPSHTHTPQGVCLDDLMLFSYQVAQGLDFLTSRNCIHRDVAARNVLLTECRVAKICDFGLARDIKNDDNYIVKGNARLPVKWMAPESIFECIYTTQSDVWSYGVLLWEIFSLGKSPYPNVAVDTNFYKMIKDGRHMAQPDFAPPEMYQLMIGCWTLEPTERPNFSTIGQLIKRLLPPTNDVLLHNNDQPTYTNIQEQHVDQERREGGEGEEGGGRGEMFKGGEEEEHAQQDREQEEEEPLMMMMLKNDYQVC